MVLGRIFGRGKSGKAGKGPAAPLTYAREKELARADDGELRVELAAREDTRPEILYYLAEDESREVRREIARNPKTPRQADKLLATDVDDRVRCDLAFKIGRLIPGVTERESTKLQNLTFEVLSILARDQLPRVRQVVAEEIRHAEHVPGAIIQDLAQDIELIVSAPILEYSVLLSDHDILEIVANSADSGVLSAISRRNNVSDMVCGAIVDSGDERAVAALLANTSAQIREETLDSLIDSAAEVTSGHEPMVRRPTLSNRAVRRITEFVATSLLNILSQRHDLDEETAQAVVTAVKKRMDEGESGANEDDESEFERAEAARAAKLHNSGKLDDEAITGAAEMGRRAFILHALSLKAKVPVETVRAIMKTRCGKAITSLAWLADLSMHTATALQKHHAQISPQNLISARGGVDFPLAYEEMEWFVAYFDQ